MSGRVPCYFSANMCLLLPYFVLENLSTRFIVI